MNPNSPHSHHPAPTRRDAGRMLATTGLLVAGFGTGAQTPDTGGVFRMPDEAAPHAATWMGFTSSKQIWGADLPAVQEDLLRIANAIAKFEPVYMLVNEAAMSHASKLRAKEVNRDRIELIVGSIDDLWLRDTGPVFVQRVGGRELRAIDFNFNGWGGKQVHSRDSKVAAFIANRLKIDLVRSTLVIEGGGVEVDGEGTAIIKESCVLNPNRNPGVSKAEAERALQKALGVTKVIWLPGPAGGDITDAHTDFYARFAGSGRVVVALDEDDTYGEQAVTQAHIKVLRGEKDSSGRQLSLTVIAVPKYPASPQAYSESFAAGYINYYLCNGGLILPAFGDRAADQAARKAMQALYPKREIVQLRVDAIAAGGGGIHCTTQQQPMG